MAPMTMAGVVMSGMGGIWRIPPCAHRARTARSVAEPRTRQKRPAPSREADHREIVGIEEVLDPQQGRESWPARGCLEQRRVCGQLDQRVCVERHAPRLVELEVD